MSNASHPSPPADRPRDTRRRRLVLWIAALLLMAGALVYQRATGPTRPRRGHFTVGSITHRYRLLRSHDRDADAPVIVAAPDAESTGQVRYRRYPTDDGFTSLPLARDRDRLAAALPAQPAAGKLEYYVVLRTPDGEVRIPAAAEGNVILRFKNPVPTSVLIPHASLMFLGILLGVRTALGALFTPRRFRGLAWLTLLALTAGGMVLGPVVQRHAFGAYWMGIPFGYDLTDNKMLVMWGVWGLACVALGWRARRRRWPGRIAVLLAALVMLAVYLIPHSLRGSELDYGKVDRGVPPAEAIGTSDR
ncbi:MAG: hypothetical protein JXQ29_02260 [Planctomycetes bacterium]|nr:hypothetical protein [Planctomycetota bacterium]